MRSEALVLAIWVGAVGLTACGGTGAEPVAPTNRPAAAASAEPKPPKGALWRQDVDQTVDQGLGYFLQRVDVMPSFGPDGAFQGFRIVELLGDGWADVDLRPGDVVLRVNGQPIEREGQAYEVFQGLKQAKTLEIQYLRAGQRRTLTFRIVPRGDETVAPDGRAAEPGNGSRAPGPVAKR